MQLTDKPLLTIDILALVWRYRKGEKMLRHYITVGDMEDTESFEWADTFVKYVDINKDKMELGEERYVNSNRNHPV